MAGELGLEVLLAGARVACAVAHVVELERAASEDRVVPAAGVLDDGHHPAGTHGPQHRALAEVDVALELDRVRRVVTLRGVVGVVAEEVDRLLALEIDEHQTFSLGDPPAPRQSRPDDGVLDDGGRIGRHVGILFVHPVGLLARLGVNGRRRVSVPVPPEVGVVACAYLLGHPVGALAFRLRP